MSTVRSLMRQGTREIFSVVRVITGVRSLTHPAGWIWRGTSKLMARTRSTVRTGLRPLKSYLHDADSKASASPIHRPNTTQPHLQPHTSATMENGSLAQEGGKDPSSFLSDIIGNPVTVKLNSGVVYKGELAYPQ